MASAKNTDRARQLFSELSDEVVRVDTLLINEIVPDGSHKGLRELVREKLSLFIGDINLLTETLEQSRPEKLGAELPEGQRAAVVDEPKGKGKRTGKAASNTATSGKATGKPAARKKAVTPKGAGVSTGITSVPAP